MLERITTVLLRPHFTAKYIAEKMSKTLFYFFIMLIIALSPTICLLKDGIVISSDEYSLMEESIRNNKGNLVIENGIINASPEFYIRTNSYNYAFLDKNYNGNRFNVIINDGFYDVYTYGIKVSSGKVILDDMIIDASSSSDEISKLTSSLYNIVYDNSMKIKTAYVITNSISFVFEFLAVVIIFYFLGSMINPIIKGRFRWTIVLYTMIPYLLFKAFAGFLGYDILSLLGLLYTYFAYYRAMKAVIKIEVKKGE